MCLSACNPYSFYTPESGHAVQEAAYANVGWIFWCVVCRGRSYFEGQYALRRVHLQDPADTFTCDLIHSQHFLNRLGSPYLALKKIINENDSTQAQILNDIRTKLRAETFTRQSILEVIRR